MAKRILLEVRSEPAWFTLTGISCHLKDYRLSYLLNEHLRFCLTKLEDAPLVPEGSKEPAPFSLYRHRDTDQCNTYYLIGNRSPETLLLPAFRQADFLLLIEGPFKKKQKDELLGNIRRIPNINTAFDIPPASVKNLEAVLTDLELHISRTSPPPKKRFLPNRKIG
jgi:hypothetical protein